jgi:hypothetical protein
VYCFVYKVFIPLQKRFDAHLYVAEYTDGMSGKNKVLRVKYGKEHKDKPFFGFWNGIHFTDEAHFNPRENLRKPKVLIIKGTRKNRENICTRKKVEKDTCTLHFFASVNW